MRERIENRIEDEGCRIEDAVAPPGFEMQLGHASRSAPRQWR
jgi:hypothetical protein